MRLLDHDVFLTTREDIIVRKLQWQRPKDLVDVTYLLGIQADRLNWGYIERWCDAQGTRTKLDELRM